VTGPIAGDGGQALFEGLRVVAGDLVVEPGAGQGEHINGGGRGCRPARAPVSERFGFAGTVTGRHRPDQEAGRVDKRRANPVQAAGASALSFTSGAVLPMLAILLTPVGLRVPVTFVAVLIALGLTGALSARLGGSDVRRAVPRVVIGGALGLAFTYGVGRLFGTAIG
jgi:VIT1/CCC1 family predicted Fe2+/Mn2+ transporter